MSVCVALCQTNIIWENKDENIALAEEMVNKAKRKRADIVFFPEMSFTGFSMKIENTMEKDFYTLERVKQIACKYEISVGFGWVKEHGTKAENHYTVLNESGNIISDYIKIHSFRYGGEAEQFISGNAVAGFVLNGIRFMPFICYDLRFPELFRVCMDETDVYVIPANWPSARRNHWITLLKARAVENQAYVLGINCVGDMDQLNYSGDSCVVKPNGEIKRSITQREGLLITNIDKDALSIRRDFPIRKDRRVELYQELSNR